MEKNIRVGAIALLKNENNEILMMLRNKKPAKDKWAIPGGKVEMFETLEETLKREMKEELGIEIEVTKFLCNVQDINKEKGEHWIMPVYEAKIVNGKVKNMEPEKHKELKWFHIEDVPENISYMTQMVIDEIKNK